MSRPLSERFIHYDVRYIPRWSVAVASKAGKTARKLQKYESFLSTHRMVPAEMVDVSEADESLAYDVAAFVSAQTGLDITCSLGNYAELPGYRHGEYIAPLHHVMVTRERVGTEYGDSISFGSLLAHEFMHSTAIHTAQIIDLQTHDKHMIHTLQPHHDSKPTAMFNTECFFEEGLAEEIASRWREQFDPSLQNRQRSLVSRGEKPQVPVRMFSTPWSIDRTSTDAERGLRYSAYCAFGIQLLSEYTGVDLIQLLIDARKPELQVNATQTLKSTVNSVEPHLYEVLTSANYSEQDFIDCLAIINDAITGHAYTQHRQIA